MIFTIQMEKRMLNTHPEMFNNDYEVEFPLDENQIVKRFDYEDIPVRQIFIQSSEYSIHTISDGRKTSLDECKSKNVSKSRLGGFAD